MLNSSDSSSDDEVNHANIRIYRRQRVIRPRINFNFFISSFKERFRIAPSTADNILNIIGPLINHRTSKNHALSPQQQLLTALHFFGCGSQYHCVGDMHGIHASTVCRIISRVSRALIQTLFHSQVCWPNTNPLSIPFGFQLIAGFPRVAGSALTISFLFSSINGVFFSFFSIRSCRRHTH